MPATVRVKVVAARDLPVMDRASEMADPFVEIKFGSTVHKTDIYSKSLNPFWNSDWYTFEADDDELQDESLQFRVMDYDTYSANDTIGRVYLDLSSVLWNKAGNSQINGWFPIYDTMHGIRGELNVFVKVNAFVDVNRYGNVCAGFEMFTSTTVPSGYNLMQIHGFVEHMVVSSDPEYQWIDKIRTPRASNEARQALFAKLSGVVARTVNRKAVETGGNAVIGYSHHFDMESGMGIVVRGVGTAVTLDKQGFPLSRSSPTLHAPSSNKSEILNVSTSMKDDIRFEETLHDPLTQIFTADVSKSCRDVDAAVKQPSSKSVPVTYNDTPLFSKFSRINLATNTEFPFITLRSLPHGIITSIGGIVSAKSVKLLKDVEAQDDDESRQIWWRELRSEIRSNMKSLNCNTVIGYEEKCCIHENLCVLCASGTAAVLTWQMNDSPKWIENDRISEKLLEIDFAVSPHKLTGLAYYSHHADLHGFGENRSCTGCLLCHVPYSENTLPFPIKLNQCYICSKGNVPEIMLASIDVPQELMLIGGADLVQARVVRSKSSSSGESLAREISNVLPFIEHQLHSDLVKRMKLVEKNAVFGMKTSLTIGESHLIATATGTAICIAALQQVKQDIVTSDVTATGKQLITSRKDDNGESGTVTTELESQLFRPSRNVSGRIMHMAELDTGCSSGEVSPPIGNLKLSNDFKICNTSPIISQHDLNVAGESIDAKNVKYSQSQMLIRVARFSAFDFALTNEVLSEKINFLIKSTLFKFRKMKPVSLSNVDFNFEFSPCDLQITMSALVRSTASTTTSAASEPVTSHRLLSTSHRLTTGNDVIDLPPLDQTVAPTSPSNRVPLPSIAFESYRKRATSLVDDTCAAKNRHVFISPLTQPPSAFLQKSNRHSSTSQYGLNTADSPVRACQAQLRYIGRYDFCFIRETHALREAGSLNCFVHSALAEVLYVVQAHVAAFGGHGLLSFQCTKTEVLENSGRNQAQCLLAVAGDIVAVL